MLKQFINKYVGKAVGVRHVGMNRDEFVGECVSMLQAYTKELGDVPTKRRGNGRDYGDSLVRDGYAKNVSTPKYGDILVYKDGFGLINGKYYGHVAIYIDANTILDQNNATVKPTRTTQLRPMLKGYQQIVRLNKEIPILDNINKYEAEVYAFTSTASKNINIRENHNTKAKIVGQLKKGQTYDYIQKYNDGKHVWVSNGKTWVAVREVKDGKRQELWGTLQAQKAKVVRNEYGQNVKVGDKIEFSYIRVQPKTAGLTPYYRNNKGRGYGIVKVIHKGLTLQQGAYEVALDSVKGKTIGYVAPINTY